MLVDDVREYEEMTYDVTGSIVTAPLIGRVTYLLLLPLMLILR